LQKISDKKAEISALDSKIQSMTVNFQGEDGTGGKLAELATLEEQLKEAIWTKKKEHEVRFRGPLSGVLNSKDNFKKKIVQERISNTAKVLSLAELESNANTLFDGDPQEEPAIRVIDGNLLLSHEINAVLGKRVIGKEDVDVAAMIRKLNNSDWVREGKSFYEANNRVCPFCQQETSEDFARSLNEYFDETFLADSKAIDKLVSDYATDADRIQQELSAAIANPGKYLDAEKLKTEKELLDSRITTNKQYHAQKKKEPSQIVSLESLANTLAAISGLISDANKAITKHNEMIKNLGRERATLTAQVWKYVVEVDLKDTFAAYDPKGKAG
jgi:wobble nucleotide-excising tRNase